MKLLTAILVPFAAAAHLGASEMGDILTPLAYAPKNTAAGVFQDAPPAQATPPAVVTSVGDILLGEGPLLDALRNELTASLSLRGDLKLEFAEPWTPLEIKNGRDWKLVVDGVPKSGLSPVSTIRFSIEAGGRILGTWQPRIRARLFEPVWVATRRLERGESLNSSVVALKEVDILTSNRDLLTADANLGIYDISQVVAADQPISSKDVALRRLVRRGKIVDIVVNEGSLSISMKGIALSDGGAGELIAVRNIDSKKDFQAQVVGDNTVQVKF
jgi:flagella basal body P-ring formation protein FlgA